MVLGALLKAVSACEFCPWRETVWSLLWWQGKDFGEGCASQEESSWGLTHGWEVASDWALAMTCCVAAAGRHTQGFLFTCKSGGPPQRKGELGGPVSPTASLNRWGYACRKPRPGCRGPSILTASATAASWLPELVTSRAQAAHHPSRMLEHRVTQREAEDEGGSDHLVFAAPSSSLTHLFTLLPGLEVVRKR